MSAKNVIITQGVIRSPVTSRTHHGVSLARIALPVANVFDVDPALIQARDRHATISEARTACAELIHELAHVRGPTLGLMMGRSTSSGYDYIQRHSDLWTTDRRYRQKLNEARAAFGL